MVSIGTAELAAWLDERSRSPPTLVDVREDAERAVSTIPGSTGARDADAAVRTLAALDRRAPVVVYCSVGVRSARAARALTLAGHLDVRNLDGGLFAWANEGRPLVADGSAAVRVHPFDARWSRLLRRELRASRRHGV